MTRQNAIVAENNFIGGLNTEASALKFPPNACTDCDNVVFSFTGSVTRRNGFDLEPSYEDTTITPTSGEAYTEYFWNAVAGNGEISLIVQQQGSTLHFFDNSSSSNISANKKHFTINLSTYVPSGSSKDPKDYPCQYAQIKGNLIVVNAATDAITVVYYEAGDDITVTSTTIKIRDFSGIPDTLDVTERPTSNLATLKTDNPEHYYNLLNQGWYTADALDQWDTALTTMPSNADTVLLYRASETDAFDSSKVTAKSPGNTPAPKGHFIFEITNQDRTAAMSAEGFTGATVGTPEIIISQSTGSTLTGNFTNTSVLWDADTSADFFTELSQCATATPTGVAPNLVWVGKNYSSSPKKITSVKLYTPDGGILPYVVLDTYTIYLQAKNGSTPTIASEGTNLGTITYVDTGAPDVITINSNDISTEWDYVWIVIGCNSETSSAALTELEFYTVADDNQTIMTSERFRTTASYAGRIFYAGINAPGLNSSICFTQIIENNDQYGLCYQKQDPTSEEFADLLPDDGGVIKIPEIGSIVKLFPYQSSLLVLASNGVWRISGSTGASFKANDYQVKKLSSIGVNNPLAVVDFSGIPLWWAEDGIYTANYNSNYDSFDVTSATLSTINSFFLDIPSYNRQFAKGSYDVFNKTVYWLYNDSETLTDPYSYNKVLCFDGIIKAFYPWSISSVPSSGSIKGLCMTVDASRISPPVMKYTVLHSSNKLTYAEHSDTSLEDWNSLGDGVDYSSYFITGYRVDGQGQKFVQNNYVFVFLNTITDSACYLQARYDWSNSGNSGKWSSSQQVYHTSQTYRDVSVRRLKVRGKGRAVQYKFYSYSNKPFDIIGWSVNESANASI